MDDEKQPALDRFIDFLFSKDNRKYLIILIIIGFLIRLFLSFRINFYADELGYTVHSIGFIDSGKLQIHDQDAVWFFLTSFFIKIFGVNILGTRFLAVLLGALTIILIYLLGKEIFNKRIALIAAAIITFSSYHIMYSIGQMDISMTFFALLAMYFLILFFKNNQRKFFFLAWLSLGIAIMIKQIALLFIPAFVLFMLYYNKKHKGNFRFRQIFYAALIIILLVSPVLTYNYLLYKDKGMLDMQFSRFFGLAEEHYPSIAHTLNPFSLETLFISHFGEDKSGLSLALGFLYRLESPIILLFSIIGIFLVIKSKNKFKWLLFLSLLFPFLFLAGTSLLPNHFVFLACFNSLFAAKGISFAASFFSEEKNKNRLIFFILALIIVTSAFQIYQDNKGFFGKNEIAKLIDYKEENINQNALVIVDSRIYRGRIALMFWDRHYLETNFFSSMVENMGQLPGEIIPLETYFIEAVTDDSGWGSVKDQPEFNQSTEQIVDFFKQNSEKIKSIPDLSGQEHFAVYKGNLNLKPSVLSLADSTHQFFLYPVNYKPEEEIFDNYETTNFFDTLLNKFAYLILVLEAIVAILLAFSIFYFLSHKSS